VPQDRGLAFGRPGPSHRREEGEPALVLEDDPGAPAPRAFFIRGQSCFTQVAIASSLRSIARRAGRCLLQPSRSRRMVQVCVWL
jgi:hypothetical protein